MNYFFALSVCTAFIFFAGIQITAAQQSVTPDRLSTSIDKIQRSYAEGRLTLEEKIRLQAFALYDPERLPQEYKNAIPAVPEKCGTVLQIDLSRFRDRLSPSLESEINSLKNISAIQASETYTSSSGRFQIHYETSGPHAVAEMDNNSNGTPDYVEWVAAAADSSWNHEIGTLGYPEFILGPSQPYEIKIRNLQTIYGETVSEGNTTFINIENDFSEGFPPNTDPEGNQKGAVKATIAHEIKHASQYAATGWSGETDEWAEMDATLMEEVVYDDVNDYYNYIYNSASIFLNPGDSFYPGSYYHVTWALYFEEKYGPMFWPGVWSIIEANPQITMVAALSEALGDEEAFIRDYTESHLWHFASGEQNSPANFGFEEREVYPHPEIEFNNAYYTEDFSIPRMTPEPEITGFSADYYEIIPNENTGKVAIDIPNPNDRTGIGLIAYFQDGTADINIYTASDATASVEFTEWSWSEITRLGFVLANSHTGSSSERMVVEIGNSTVNSTTLSQNYPNPFGPETRIRFTVEQTEHVKLSIYDTAGRLVRTVYDQELSPGIYEPVFNGEGLASGIYFYRLMTDHSRIVKKMTLIK